MTRRILSLLLLLLPAVPTAADPALQFYQIRYGPMARPPLPGTALTIGAGYGSLPAYTYVDYTYTHHHVPVDRTIAWYHTVALRREEVEALFGGRDTIRLSRVQEADIQKIHQELSPGAPPLAYGAVRDGERNPLYDADGWVRPDTAWTAHQAGRTLVWPADFVYGEGRLYWNLTTPAVFEYLVRYSLKLQSYNRHARLFVDESGTYGDELFMLLHVARGSDRQRMAHVAARLNALNRAIKARPDPAGRWNQGLILNSGWRQPGTWTGAFWNQWYETLASEAWDTFDGLMVENLWMEDGWVTNVAYYRDKIVALAGKQILFAATAADYLWTPDHPKVEQLWLWLHLVAEPPDTYAFLNPSSEDDVIDYAVYAHPLGAPQGAPWQEGTTWCRWYEAGLIVFDTAWGSLDGIQIVRQWW